MSNLELRQMATAELSKAIGSALEAIRYLALMDKEIKEYQEIAADVAEMLR